MALSITQRNRIALVLLVAAKICGITGLILAYASHRTAGAVLLGLAFVLIVLAVGLAVSTMRASGREDDGNRAVIEKMLREGTLSDVVREAERKVREERAGDSTTED